MESSWAQNKSHLPKLMWRPVVSLLACKIFIALDRAKVSTTRGARHFGEDFSVLSCTLSMWLDVDIDDMISIDILGGISTSVI